MPIKPPNLDDRRYEDIVAEARSLIPQYCPEWTNLGDADPGMTLVQLFAWMTELTIYRLNRVPDKTYVHFLNFIGEERRRARPAVVPLTFELAGDDSIELQPFTTCSTRQREDNVALDFVTVDGLTVHASRVIRVMGVRGGDTPVVREIPFEKLGAGGSALTFSGGRGVQFFELDPLAFGPDAYTPHQYLYLAHDDFRLMDIDPEDDRPLGRLRVRRGQGDTMSIASFFTWEYPTKQGWVEVEPIREEDELLGMPEVSLVTAMPGIVSMDSFELGDQQFARPRAVEKSNWWIRGRLDYERWLAERMLDDLQVTWKDDRGGEDRVLNNWEVRASGRTLEFFLQDLPPIRGGWTVRMAMIDRDVPAGKNSYLPRYRWFYRRGDSWELVPKERVRTEGSMIQITGPLTDMATDGFNLRAERVQTVFLRGFCPDLETELTWLRPVEVDMLAGDDPRRTEALLAGESPWSPFQINANIPPTIGRKLYIGSDLFANRPQAPVLMEIEVGFEMNGELIAEPTKLYQLQLTYRAEDNWRVVWTKNKLYSAFTFAKIDKDGAKRKARRKIRITLDPKTQLKGLSRHEIGAVETAWLRLELVKSSLTGQDENKDQHPIVPRIYGVKLGVDKTLGDVTYEQPMPGPRMAQLDFRPENRRLTRVMTRVAGRLAEDFPFYPFVEIEESNQSLYMQFDKPLPVGAYHGIHFRCRGEAFLPSDMGVEWEYLEDLGRGRTGWRRIKIRQTEDEGETLAYDLDRSGVLEFSLSKAPKVSSHGFWIRGRFTKPDDVPVEQLPTLPPVTHLMLNTTNALNLHTQRTERYSGLAVPNQTIQLQKKPIFIDEADSDRSIMPRVDVFDDLKVFVEEANGAIEEWLPAREGSLLTASKDDRVFVVDPVEATLTFGNGIRGRMLPSGSNNVVVDIYRVVPGTPGNVGPGEVELCEAYADSVEVSNLLPGTGGRDAETVDEIVRRAPSLLSSRDRAVTRADFEIIGKEASGEVARAACGNEVTEDGHVHVVILPRRREGEQIPDPFLSTGLRDHVSRYLKRRCLVNVEPVVRLASFMPIDVSLTLRLRPNANVLAARDQAESWAVRFLDPYEGGLDGEGWPFSGTLYSQDFARMVSDIPEVRHVVDVQLFDMSTAEPDASAGWESGEGDAEIILESHDLYVVRRIRVLTEEGVE